MSDFDPANCTADHPSKRRKVHDDAHPSPSPQPPYSSPDSHHGGHDALPPRSLSIRRGRPPTRSRSRSASLDNDDDEPAEKKHYYSSSPSRSRSRSPTSTTSGTPSPRRRRSSSGDDRTSTRSSPRRRRTSFTPSPVPPLRPAYRRHMELRGHAKPISQVRISPNGRWIASASADGTARIWDADSGTLQASLVGHMAGVSCLAWSPDSESLATGSDDKAIRLWDRVTAEPAHGVGEGAGESVVREGGGARGSRRPLLGHHSYVYCLAFSPKGNILASGSYDEAVFLWDVRAGRLMRSLPAHSDPVSGIAFCRDGTLVVSCSTDGLIRIWDTSTGQCLRTLLLLNEDNPAVTNVCFSPNGRYVLAFNLDSCIRLWDYIPHPSTVKKTYQGHRNASFSVGGCFGMLGSPSRPQQPFVAAASEDGDVVLWDVTTKEVVQRLRGVHDGVCFWVDVCGQTMVSCGKDGRIVVFRNEGPGEEPVGAEVGQNGVGVGDGEVSADVSTYHTPDEGVAVRNGDEPGSPPLRENSEMR